MVGGSALVGGGFGGGDGEAQPVEDLLEVGPDLFAVVGGVLAEEEGGVEGGHEVDAVEGAPLAPLAGDGESGVLEEVLGGGGAEGDDDGGADDVDLAEEEGHEELGFLGCGDAVAGGPDLADVADVDLLAGEAHGGDLLVEQLAGPADEGAGLEVLVGAGRLADEHEGGVGVALAEDDVFPAVAGPVVVEVFGEFGEELGECGGFLIECEFGGGGGGERFEHDGLSGLKGGLGGGARGRRSGACGGCAGGGGWAE